MKEKIKSLDELKMIRERLKMEGKKLVFTNGCFDLIHIGHIRYLKMAKQFGDLLVVAINSDSSVRKIKGIKRPVIPQDERAEIIASLEFVDFVTVFDEPDPYNLIKELRPDFLIKGGDWKPEEIVGSDIVKAYGGSVISLPYLEGHSTSQIIERIVSLYSEGF
ncbi:MAG: D-glycero-beta-D-manno-heptose 1-phosphate adenylyltransferase [Candidatus Aenigmatarchaeota archaeon]